MFAFADRASARLLQSLSFAKDKPAVHTGCRLHPETQSAFFERPVDMLEMGINILFRYPDEPGNFPGCQGTSGEHLCDLLPYRLMPLLGDSGVF